VEADRERQRLNLERVAPDWDKSLTRPDVMQPANAQPGIDLFDVGHAAVSRAVGAGETADVA
jgi:hypothetical protein